MSETVWPKVGDRVCLSEMPPRYGTVVKVTPGVVRPIAVRWDGEIGFYTSYSLEKFTDRFSWTEDEPGV